MVITPDAATEQRIQRQLDRGTFREPADLLALALDLVEAEEQDLAVRRAHIVSRLEESIAQADRGEGITGEELRAGFNARLCETLR